MRQFEEYLQPILGRIVRLQLELQVIPLLGRLIELPNCTSLVVVTDGTSVNAAAVWLTRLTLPALRTVDFTGVFAPEIALDNVLEFLSALLPRQSAQGEDFFENSTTVEAGRQFMIRKL